MIDVTQMPDGPEKRAAIRAAYSEAVAHGWEPQTAFWRDYWLGMNGVPLDASDPRYVAALAELNQED